MCVSRARVPAHATGSVGIRGRARRTPAGWRDAPLTSWCVRAQLSISLVRAGTTGKPMSCECGCCCVAPASKPLFLKIIANGTSPESQSWR